MRSRWSCRKASGGRWRWCSWWFTEQVFHYGPVNGRLSVVQADVATPPASTRRDPVIVSKAMRAVRSKGTRPEMRLRCELFRRGLRYRVASALPGKPDIVFRGARVAVFVDGDFWHGRQWQTRGFESLEAQFANVNGAGYWVGKISRTMARDKRVTGDLESAGWRVVRFWETDILADAGAAADKVTNMIRGAR